MRNIEEIMNIVDNLSEEMFEKLNKADSDAWFSRDRRVRKNGRSRLLYNLKKVGLTEKEWDLWCAW